MEFESSTKFLAAGLVKIVACSLAVILIASISTEVFLNSNGFESRKESFGCLVDHLSRKNMTDENFGVAKSLNLSSVDCESIVQQQNKSFYDDLKQRIKCPIYNVTSAQCDKLNNPICSDLKLLTDESNETCYINEFSGMFDITSEAGQEKLLAICNLSRMNCEKLLTCTSCVNEKLAATNYEEARFHSTAVNLTMIEFQIWKYFSISTRVKKLMTGIDQLEKASIQRCVREKRCLKCAD